MPAPSEVKWREISIDQIQSLITDPTRIQVEGDEDLVTAGQGSAGQLFRMAPEDFHGWMDQNNLSVGAEDTRDMIFWLPLRHKPGARSIIFRHMADHKTAEAPMVSLYSETYFKGLC